MKCEGFLKYLSLGLYIFHENKIEVTGEKILFQTILHSVFTLLKVLLCKFREYKINKLYI